MPGNPNPKTDHLTPITKANAAEYGRRGAAKREANRRARTIATVGDTADLNDLLSRYNHQQLGPTARAAAIHTITRITAGDVPIRHGTDAANLITALHTIARLEAGQPTVLTGKDTLEMLDRIDQLREQAGQLPHEPVDVPTVDPPTST